MNVIHYLSFGYTDLYKNEIIIKYFGLLFYIVPFLIILIYIYLLKSYKIVDVNFKPFIKDKAKPVLFFLLFLIYLSSFLKSSFKPLYKELNIDFNLNFYLLIFSMIILGPLVEEIMFRSILLDPFIKKNKIIFGVILTSILYSFIHFSFIFHTQYFTYLNFLDYLIFGILLAIIRIKFGLKFAIFAHSFRNLLAILSNYNIFNFFIIEYINSKMLFKVVYFLSIFIILISLISFLNKLKRK